MSALRLIVGLGNPGRKYDGTRHNVGFMLLDRLAAAGGVEFKARPKWEADAAELADGTVLLKPRTFMNLSGRSVQRPVSFYKWDRAQILVAYDDVALPLGTLRLREKGSAGGHNGMRSLIDHLGGSDFPRLRIGIGGAQGGELSGHVLGSFSPDEREQLENVLASAEEAVQLSRSRGVAVAANAYNARAKSSEPSTHEQEIRRADRPGYEGS